MDDADSKYPDCIHCDENFYTVQPCRFPLTVDGNVIVVTHKAPVCQKCGEPLGTMQLVQDLIEEARWMQKNGLNGQD